MIFPSRRLPHDGVRHHTAAIITMKGNTMSRDRRQEFHDLAAGKGTVPYLTSAWQHFIGNEYDVERQAWAHINFVRKWDWDWVKINPRSAYYTESWGARFDPNDYGTGRSPRLLDVPVHETGDLAKITPLDPTSAKPFADQLASARIIRRELPDRAILETVFSPLTVLLGLAGLPRINGKALYGIAPTLTKDELLFTDERATAKALDAITETLVDYVRTALAPVEQSGAGLDGVFYAETGMASRGYFTHEQFLKLARPYDERILEAVGDGVKLLHTCRDHANPDWFADYDIDFLQWNQYVPGNPPISDDFNAVAVGGPDAVLIGEGTDADELRHQVKATLDERRGRPFLLAPSCTIPPRPDDEHLRILREA